MKRIFIVASFVGLSLFFTSPASAQFWGPLIPAQPVVPPVVYKPQITYVPYQYMGSSYTVRRYRTPVRDLILGTGFQTHYYGPQIQGQNYGVQAPVDQVNKAPNPSLPADTGKSVLSQ